MCVCECVFPCVSQFLHLYVHVSLLYFVQKACWWQELLFMREQTYFLQTFFYCMEMYFMMLVKNVQIGYSSALHVLPGSLIPPEYNITFPRPSELLCL